jgi:serine/threonine-protein kinase HipA
MKSNHQSDTEAYVWIWLPQETSPVVAGKLTQLGGSLVFNYGQSYLARENAIAYYEPELPLIPGRLPLPSGMSMPSCIRDASPDAGCRRVIINRQFLSAQKSSPDYQLNELTYLLESGSDRIGALDFQCSPTVYEPRTSTKAPLDELMDAAMRVEQGIPLSPALNEAINHRTSIGGARPKALIEDHDIKYIAKFSSSSNLYNVVKSEFIAMRLAQHCGLNVAEVTLTRSSNKDVLSIKRFDREASKNGWLRKSMVSTLTLIPLHLMI